MAPLIIDVDENPGYTFETYEDDPNDDEICDFDDVDIDDMDIDKIEYEKTMGDESSHNINALNNELIDENIIDDIFFQPIKHYKVENEKIFRIQELKKEIENYLKCLKELEEIDVERLKKILKEKSESALNEYRKPILEKRERLLYLKNIFEDIKKFSDLSKQIKENVENKLNKEYILSLSSKRGFFRRKYSDEEMQIRLSLQQNIESFVEIIDGQYAKLNDLRELINKKLRMYNCEGNTLADIEKQLRIIEKELTEEIVELEADHSKLNVFLYLDKHESEEVNKFIKILSCIVINEKIIAKEKYKNLLQLLTLSTLKKECAEIAIPMDENDLSIVCRELFNEICQTVIIYENEFGLEQLWKKVFKDVLPGYTIERNAYGQFMLLTEDLLINSDTKKSENFVISKNFLEATLEEIEGKLDISFPNLIGILLKRFSTNKELELLSSSKNSCRNLVDKCKTFIRLYMETPEQRLVTEQRYYNQKMLEQEKEKNFLLELQMRREERVAEEQLKLEREKIQSERLRAYEEDRRRREEQERAKRETMHLCYRCANYGNGCHGGIAGCGNFRPKR